MARVAPSTLLRRPSASAGAVRATAPALLTTVLSAAFCASCGPTLLAPEPVPPSFEPVGQTKCSIAKSQLKPLVVEWPGADRAALEARALKGIVAVRYQGCEMEVLTRCKAVGNYSYTPTTLKTDELKIRNADELYANIPIYAAKLEAKLAQRGELGVAMLIVGRYEAELGLTTDAHLEGDCAKATHLVAAYTVGAFELSAGAATEAGGEASVLDIGGGVKSRAERETLSRDGNTSACELASTSDSRPPNGCGALVRIEVVPIDRATTTIAQRNAPTPSTAPAPAERTGAATTAPTGMARIPAGTLRLDDGKTVRIGAFEIDVAEVTVAAYKACVEAGRCTPRSTASIGRYSRYCTGASRTKPLHPMNCIDWQDAARFCGAQGKRLPTAEEWQVAAESGDGRAFPWGADEPDHELLNACGSECTKYALYRGNDGFKGTAPVGSFPAGRNGYGLLDMAGNVREWTQGQARHTKASTAAGLEPGRNCWDKVKGCELHKAMGSWYGTSMIERAASGSYEWLRVEYRDPGTGFRCARTLTE